MRSLVPIFLLLLFPPLGHAQDSLKEDRCRRVGLYEVRRIDLPHSARLHDTLTIGLCVLVDCTMRVTRVDTSIRKNRLTVSVYGTYVREGCPHPLCPARIVTHQLTIRPESPGTLKVIVRNPGGRRLTASTEVRKHPS